MITHVRIAATFGFCLIAAAPVFAQGAAEGPKSVQGAQQQAASTDALNSSDGATKQHTQGLPAGTVPPQYGADWSRKQEQAHKTQ